MVQLKDTLLMKALAETGNLELHGALLALPETVGTWLSYVPDTFPHYTQHTQEHSLELINQLGKLLYDDQSMSCVIDISPMEIYLLVLSSYLHDAGMVASDAEKLELLQSEDWLDFIAEGNPGHLRWTEIEKVRQLPDAEGRYLFAASRLLRFLIADFLRRSHHLRSGALFTTHGELVERFILGEATVAPAVSAICAGHGMERVSYPPTQRDFL